MGRLAPCLVAAAATIAGLAARAQADCGDGPACLADGEAQGKAHPETYAPALRSYQRACDLGAARGCAEAANIYDSGRTWNGVARDVDKALALYRKACENGYAPACDSLGLMLYAGEDVTHDNEAAARWFRKACDAGAMHGCTSLGYFYQAGLTVKSDRGKARELYLKACDGGDYQGCDNTALLDAGTDDAKALEMFERGCKLDSGFGCKRAAELHRAAKHTALAADRFHHACLRHETDACYAYCELVPGKGPCLSRIK
ncbi:MAG TPA: tetratricopeptide repeat protein [Kofleriaceae bacterium]|nr:tetratricopeptide repeat protein [Kofleriaceae bacterium]